MSENTELPNGWVNVRISDVGDLLRGVSYKKEDATNKKSDNYIPILRANNINGELKFDELVYVPKKYVVEEQLIKQGDIVFAMSSGSKHLVGKSAKAKIDYNGSYGAFCALYRPTDAINKSFIAYFFQGSSYKKLIYQIAKGTNINNLKREHILDLDFPLPEQHAIVFRIEQLFSELDKGIESLKTAQQQLKVYRQSVLKSAFDGKLTEKWRQNQDLPDAQDLLEKIQKEREEKAMVSGKKLKQVAPLTKDELDALPELPEGWGCVRSGELYGFVTSGSRGWAKYYSAEGAIFLRITNLDFDSLELDLSPENIQYVKPPQGTEGQRTRIFEGDFIF